MTWPRPAPRARPAAGARHNREHGSLAVVQATWLLVLVVLGGVAVLDVGALLRGARVAAAAADGAALAAASASRGDAPAPPRTAADRIARAHGATLARCETGPRGAQVTVTRSVDTMLLHRLGVTQVTASAHARLVRVTPSETSRAQPASRAPP